MLTAIPRVADDRGARRRPAHDRRPRRRHASNGRARCCRCCARPASSTQERQGSSRSFAASSPRSQGTPLPEAPEHDRELGLGRDSTRSCRATATAPSSSSRATLSTPTRSRPSSSSSATRCSSSATRAPSRCTCTPTTRAARSRSASRAESSAGVEIANMHEQTLEREERLLHAVPTVVHQTCAVVAVAAGAGNRRLCGELRRGGRRRWPDDESLDGGPAGGDRERGRRRSRRAPEQRQRDHERRAGRRPRVEARSASCRRRSVQAGLAALVAFDPTVGAEANAEAMTEAVDAVATGAITIASRDVVLDGVEVRKGDWLGLADESPSPAATRSTRSRGRCSPGCSTSRAAS